MKSLTRTGAGKISSELQHKIETVFDGCRNTDQTTSQYLLHLYAH